MMKDIVVLFNYSKVFPMTVGGDESFFAVGLDCSTGGAHELFFYYDDDGFSIASLADIFKPLTYDEVRKLAREGHKNGFVDDPSIYDALDDSTWRAFIEKLPDNSRHIITNDNTFERIYVSL